jgi:hypothetical protein
MRHPRQLRASVAAYPYQLLARACSTQRGRPWPRHRARSTAAKVATAVPAPEATRATGPRRRTRPMQVKPTDPGRLPAEPAQTSRTSPPSLTRTHVWPRVRFDCHRSEHGLCTPSTRRIPAGARSGPAHPLYWVQRARLRRNAVAGCSHICSTEYVVNLSCASREAWSTRSHPAAPLLQHVDTAPEAGPRGAGALGVRPAQRAGVAFSPPTASCWPAPAPTAPCGCGKTRYSRIPMRDSAPTWAHQHGKLRPVHPRRTATQDLHLNRGHAHPGTPCGLAGLGVRCWAGARPRYE